MLQGLLKLLPDRPIFTMPSQKQILPIHDLSAASDENCMCHKSILAQTAEKSSDKALRKSDQEL